MPAEQLMIRVAIEALNAEFAYRIDHGLGDTVAELFTTDGVYGRSTGERSVGRDAIRQAYSLRAVQGPRTARHLFTNLRLSHEAPDLVHGTTILLLFAEDGSPPGTAQPLVVADYEDSYTLEADGQWRYRSRLIHTLFVDPSGKRGNLPLGSA